MPKQNVSINFSQGLNTKTDPWQVPLGQFESLQNSIFQKGGLLQKRNGYGELTALSLNQAYLTTLNDNLTAIGSTVSAYSSSLEEWITKGTLQPCSLTTLPLIRNNLNQTQCDIAVASGMVLTTYTQTNTTTSAVVTSYLYALADAVTGQNIIEPSAIPVLAGGAISGSSRAYVVGNYFVIVSPVLVSSTTFLQYVSIPISNPVILATNLANVSPAQNVTTDAYVPITSNPGWDGATVNNSSNNVLVVAYNTTTGAQGIHVSSLTAQQIAANSASTVIHAFANAAYIGAIVSVCADITSNPNVFYVSFWNNSTSNGYTCAVYLGFGGITTQFTPQQIISSVSVTNLASAAQNGSCLVFSEVSNAYSYDSTIPSNFIDAVTVSSAGTVGTPYVAIRSVGLASKAFIVGGSVYFLSAFQSTFQPTYFLVNGSTTTAASPIIVSKLAYQNGAGYAPFGLPNVAVNGSVAQLPYLYKDDVEALNTLNNPQQTTAGGIYSQTGVNLVSLTLGTSDIDTAELASNLHISGGYLSQFDGYLPVEHNFFLFPDSIECSYNASSTVTPTGTVTSGSKVITTVSSVSGIAPGMTITGTAIPAGAVVVLVGTSTITISAAATGNHTSETLTIQGNIAAVPVGGTAGLGAYYYTATYEWTDNQGLPYRSSQAIPVPITTTGSGATGTVTISVPTLRLTAKVANPVKIVIYRWSENTQVYNQVTSITAPVLNSTTVDYVSFVDTLPDANVVGNNILYTTGGVVGDCNAPSSTIMTLFDTRLWLVDAENPNMLWVSKQVIPGTPVEMSNQFTIYVAPTTGVISSLGPITGMAPMDDKIILFFASGIFYINGVGPNNLGTTAVGCSLGNYSQPTFITTSVGCTNQQSIVLTSDGLMFQSDKGIWLLDRNLKPSYIGAPIEAFNGYTVNSANSISETNYVLFTLTGTNTMLMYDYYYNQWGTFVGVSAISSCIYQGLHTVIDTFGRILQETPGQYLDAADAVLMSFTTSWLNIASLQGYERFIDFYILAKYLSPHSLLCSVAYDYNSSILNQKLITPQNYSPATPSSFGVPTPFGSPGNKEQWRIHAKQQLCESFQLSITEVFNPAYNTVPGAGFTMSGLTCEVMVKKGTRPISGSNAAGMS